MARRRQQPAPATVERRIFFYRVNLGQNNAGRPVNFDPAGALRHIDGLPYTPAGQYVAGPDNTSLCAWIDNGRQQPCMRLGTIRRGGFPQVERSGVLSDLTLTADAGLAEVTHLAFFPQNILGAVFNFYGPRPTRLGPYLAARVPGIPPDIAIEPLLRQDVLAELNRLGGLRLFDLKVRRSYADTVAQADASLGAAFQAAAEAGEADLVQVVLRTNRQRASRLRQNLRTVARNLLGRADLREEAERFVVAGVDTHTERVVEVDLLSDKLVSVKRIVSQGGRSKALDADSAYEAITTAHQELRDELHRAAGVGQ